MNMGEKPDFLKILVTCGSGDLVSALRPISWFYVSKFKVFLFLIKITFLKYLLQSWSWVSNLRFSCL